MRKTIMVLLSASLVFGAFAVPHADAKKKKPKKVVRKAESVYDTPAIGHPDVVVGCSGSTGCATFAIGANEAFASFEIVDSLGQPVYGSVSQDLDGDGLGDVGFNFCGKTEAPQPIEPGYAINIFIGAGPGTSPACVGAATTGVVKGTFSNLP
jgi:hypothetical protein